MQMSGSQHRIVGEHLYDGAVFPGIVQDATLNKMQQTIFDDSDVIVTTYPKSGTTLMQEIVYLIITEGDTKTSDKVTISSRCPFLEVTVPGRAFLEEALKTEPPRFMKSHLSAKYFKETLQKAQTKFVVVMRNPKDVLVSFYHFYRSNESLNLFPGTWDEFFTLFQQDRLVYGNYFESVGSWWKLRDNPNILIVKYEDILANPHKSIREVALHLGKNISDDLVSKIAHRTAFKNMKNISTLNYSYTPFLHQNIVPFMRKGEVGDWKNYFSEEQNKIVDELYKKHCEANGLVFQFQTISSKF